ncbi:MAG: hypothetical protein ABI378_06515 [Chitinophagaceae bacterium]
MPSGSFASQTTNSLQNKKVCLLTARENYGNSKVVFLVERCVRSTKANNVYEEYYRTGGDGGIYVENKL